MFSSFKYTARLFRIGYTLARHDALFGLEVIKAPVAVTFLCKLLARRNVHERHGKRLANALEELGPTFIKVGQALSTRSDLVGEDIANDLSELQDKLPPFDSKKAKEIIEYELERSIDELFSEFEEEAVAAASIAQVHFAVTTEGKEVAVKVLRPNIEDQIKKDMELLFWLGSIAERRMPQWRRLKPLETVKTFAESMQFELDMRYEAAAATELRDNTFNDEGFYVPEIDWRRTSQRVLVLERLHGTPVNDIAALREAGHDLNKIVERAAITFFFQVFRDGFFHADMHPGNIFVLEDGTLAVVDFGIMGRIDRNSQLYLAEMLWSFLREDYRRVAEIHIGAGYVPRSKSVDLFAQANMAIAKPIFGKPLNEISIARLLAQLFQVAETFEMETQPQLLMLQKTMMLAEGVGRQLNPDVNMWQMAEPLIADWARKNLGPQAKVKYKLEEIGDSLQKIPTLIAEAERIVERVNKDGFQLDDDTLRRMQRSRNSFQRQWLFLAWATLGVLSALFLVEL